MSELEPITREEMLLNSIAGEGASNIEPVTRKEHYLSAIAGETDLPAKMQEEGPITREEIYYQKILDNGGGGGGEASGTKQISITENGVSTHNIKAYATAEITTNVPNPSTGTKQINANGTHDVTDYASAQVNVPNSYSASDEGKVVDDGALVSQTSKNITANDTYDTTLNNSVVVNVPNPSTGTKSISTNGTHDVTDYASASVNVPNSYSASDEGKVVSNGALVAQTSQNITVNGTYDTTLNDEVVVNVSGGGGGQYQLDGVQQIVLNTILDSENDVLRAVTPRLSSLTVHNFTGTEVHLTGIRTTVALIAGAQPQSANGTLQIIDLDGAVATIGQYQLRYMSKLTEINAHLKITNATGFGQGCGNIVTCFFAENQNAISFSLTSVTKLSDESLISCANGLSESTPATLTATAAQKTKFDTIVGDIEEVAGDTPSHRFTVDAQGSTTLTSFITTTKGWTIA